MEVTTVGLDLAKHVFQVHAVNAEGAIVLRKALRRGQMLPFFAKLPPCLIGMEACGTSHHWAHEDFYRNLLCPAIWSHPSRQRPRPYVVALGLTIALTSHWAIYANTRR
jgi:hypothetical protein